MNTSSVEKIDLEYRPPSYFWPLGLEKHLLARVKGAKRKAALKNLIASGRLDEIPEFLAKSSLSEEDRQAFGRLHPMFMGGEYLPTANKEEVEVARIRINSTTGDVTSVYARVVGKRIAYRVVDEYQGDTLADRVQRTSSRPLMMGQLIEFFLGAWDLYVCLDGNFEGDLEEMLGFFEGESEFYPYLDSELRRLVREKFPPLEDDEED